MREDRQRMQADAPDPYRAPPATPPVSVVTYFPMGRLTQIVFALCLGAAFVACVKLGVTFASSVILQCERAAGTCAVISRFESFTSTRTIPISSIRSTRLDTSGDKKRGFGYSLVLVTTSGDVAISNVASNDHAARVEAKRLLDLFLQDPKQPDFDVLYDPPAAGGYVVLAFSLLVLFFVWFVARWARVEIDWGKRVVTVVRMGWPLPPRRLRFELGAVSAAVVRSRKRNLFAVDLFVEGRSPVPLLPGTSSGREPKQSACDAINALLARRNDNP
jgi:hypothetical protein